MAKRNRAVAYLRRSDKSQKGSLAEQREEIKRYAARESYEILHWYEDDGITGDSIEERPHFSEMRNACDSGDFQFILCWDQARFGRFDSIDWGFAIKPMRDAKVTLVLLDEGPQDWDSFTGRMMSGMKQEGKHQYLPDLSRNVSRGQIEAAKNNGSWTGAKPYGYDLEGLKKHKKLKPNADAWIVERIFREFVVRRRSLNAIAKGLNADRIKTRKGGPWRYDAVKTILENPVYVGTFRTNRSTRCKYGSYRNGQYVSGAHNGIKDERDWVVIPNNHEAIIDQVMFEKAQDILASTGRTGGSHYTHEDNPFLLSGLLVCGHCEKRLRGGQGRKGRVYRCETEDCGKCHVHEEKLLGILIAHLKREFLTDDEQRTLFRKAKRGELTKNDVPEGFKKLKHLLVGKSPRNRANTDALKAKMEKFDAGIALMRRNLARAPDKATFNAIYAEIDVALDEQARLNREIMYQPTEEETNAVVIGVLQHLWLLGKMQPARLKPVLREIKCIKVWCKSRGSGRATRYTFDRGELEFRGVGGPTGKLNLHRLFQRQAAYH
jgi:DNA invertase Pin-like site-specific DNA recombinase